MTIGRAGVSVAEADGGDPDTRVSGPQAAWILAFSPEHDRSELRISGQRTLAEHVLDGLGTAARRARAANAAA